MKRILLIMVMMLTVVGAKAQVTMNARAGIGVLPDDNGDSGAGFFGIFQMNIPFKKGGRFTLSPSVELDLPSDASHSRFVFPLNVGCKVPMGNRNLYFPKIGPVVGYNGCSDDVMAIAGLSTEHAFEFKHFIVAVGAYYSFVMEDHDILSYGSSYVGTNYTDVYGVHLTLGYKF